MNSVLEDLLSRNFTQRFVGLGKISLATFRLTTESAVTQTRGHAKSRFLNDDNFDPFVIRFAILTQRAQGLNHRIDGIKQ